MMRKLQIINSSDYHFWIEAKMFNGCSQMQDEETIKFMKCAKEVLQINLKRKIVDKTTFGKN